MPTFSAPKAEPPKVTFSVKNEEGKEGQTVECEKGKQVTLKWQVEGKDADMFLDSFQLTALKKKNMDKDKDKDKDK